MEYFENKKYIQRKRIEPIEPRTGKYNLFIVGSGAVGTWSLWNRFLFEYFPSKKEPFMGEYYKTITIDDNTVGIEVDYMYLHFMKIIYLPFKILVNYVMVLLLCIQ